MRSILILRGGALGDFIVTLPAIAALRTAFPTARIELVGNATAATLALNRQLLDAVHSQHESRWSALYTSAPFPSAFSAWLGSFDLIINFWPDSDGDLARHFPLHPAQRFLTAPALPTLAPAAAHYCAPLQQLGIVAPSSFYALAAPATSARLIALHPGSGSIHKNWLLADWVELAAWLKLTHSAELLIITGEAESPSIRTALSAYGTEAHQLPLEALVAQLTSCRGFIGHDSGISHLAAACGVLSLLLFGPTDHAIWAPPVGHVRVLRETTSLTDLSLSAVQVALTSTLLARR
jgi:heptosyltransferase-3